MDREEAIKKIKEAMPTMWKETKDAVETLVPELAESEDERIRKVIVKYFKELHVESWINLEIPNILAWLEKQKETGIRWFKSDNVKNPDKPHIDKTGMFYTTDGRMCYASEIEKQKEVKWSPSEGEMGVLYKLCYVSNQITDEDDTELTRLYQDLKREYFNGHSFENMFLKEKQKEPKPSGETNVEPDSKIPREEYLYHLLANHIITFTDYTYLLAKKPFDYECANIPQKDYTPVEQKSADLSEMMVHKEPYIAPVPTPMVADEQKPEWSEEDEKMLNLTKTQLRILQSHLSHAHSESMSDMEYSSQLLQIEKCVSWLDIHFKSLRPQPMNIIKIDELEDFIDTELHKDEFIRRWPQYAFNVPEHKEGDEYSIGVAVGVGRVINKLRNFIVNKKA